MSRDDLICMQCKNFKNHAGTGCLAFPDGIPNSILDSNIHDKPIKGQGNDLIFDPS